MSVRGAAPPSPAMSSRDPSASGRAPCSKPPTSCTSTLKSNGTRSGADRKNRRRARFGTSIWIVQLSGCRAIVGSGNRRCWFRVCVFRIRKSVESLLLPLMRTSFDASRPVARKSEEMNVVLPLWVAPQRPTCRLPAPAGSRSPAPAGSCSPASAGPAISSGIMPLPFTVVGERERDALRPRNKQAELVGELAHGRGGDRVLSGRPDPAPVGPLLAAGRLERVHHDRAPDTRLVEFGHDFLPVDVERADHLAGGSLRERMRRTARQREQPRPPSRLRTARQQGARVLPQVLHRCAPPVPDAGACGVSEPLERLRGAAEFAAVGDPAVLAAPFLSEHRSEER